jgi:hypothetical protein
MTAPPFFSYETRFTLLIVSIDGIIVLQPDGRLEQENPDEPAAHH